MYKNKLRNNIILLYNITRMGNAEAAASVITEVINKSITNVLIENSSSCTQNNSIIQDINISRIKSAQGCNLEISGISQQAIQAPNLTCISSSANTTDLMNKIEAKLKQEAKASAESGIGKSDSKTNSTSKLINEVKNNMNISNVVSCVQNTLAQQSMNISDIEISCPKFCQTMKPSDCNGSGAEKACALCTAKITDIRQTIVQEAVSKCLNNNETLTKAINEAAADFTQSATSSSKGNDVFGFLSSFGTISIILIITIAIVCLSSSSSSFGLMATSSKNTKTTQPIYQTTTQPMYQPMYQPTYQPTYKTPSS